MVGMSDGAPEGMMRAMRLVDPLPVTEKPLQLVELPIPSPGPGEVLIRVEACGVCHTDLHTVEGELDPHRESVIPGHEIVGEIVAFGDWPGGDRPDYPAADGRPLELGERVGVPWLWRTDGQCRFCRRGQENLCEHALFTGYDVDGGYAEYHVAAAPFVYRLPSVDGEGRPIAATSLAPLLCAGVIGYRCLRLAGVVGDDHGLPGRPAPTEPGAEPAQRPSAFGAARARPSMRVARLRSVAGAIREVGGSPSGGGPLDMVDGILAEELDEPAGRLGLFGFGAAAHLCLQIAVSRGWQVYVFTRSEEHRRLARELGAVWAGASGQRPGAPAEAARQTPGQLSLSGRDDAMRAAAAGDETWLDAAIVFAPAGELALEALKVVDKAGIVALGGIHSSPIPPIDYPIIYDERVLRSVANSTRRDAVELLRTAAAVPVRTEVETFPLEQANDVLIALKESRIRGAAVLQIG